MVPPCCGWGWHTKAASRGSPSSGSSSRASRRPAGPSRNSDSILLAKMLIGPVVSELHVDPEIARAQQLHHVLQRVAILAGDAQEVALDRCLDFLLAVLDHFHDVARLLDGDALLQADLLAHAGSGRRGNGPVNQAF